MILCHEHKFIFLKTRKTAGTSVECALSAFCGPEDVITPFRRAEDEAMRAGRGPQNWDVRAIPLYRRAGRRIGLFGGQANSGSFYNHIQAADARALIG
ncbi:MAG: hypothetical protein H7X92_14570, partial [Chitinophagales bacterium]|nr:hypothetical protein [Hyphomicrobiales bacterium]